MKGLTSYLFTLVCQKDEDIDVFFLEFVFFFIRLDLIAKDGQICVRVLLLLTGSHPRSEVTCEPENESSLVLNLLNPMATATWMR